ncbi:hypothetical protein [Amycolatopsis sp. cg9]|uniref:hypothetical protein n=1 Tax=Amycolatopsis sp. cg9 TaxID=3238801 RepID=UPI003523AD92
MGDYLAAPRDASSFARPDTRTTKVYHASEAGQVHSSGQPLSSGYRLLSAVCSHQVLDDYSAVALEEAPEELRCRRPACARIWREHANAVNSGNDSQEASR